MGITKGAKIKKNFNELYIGMPQNYAMYILGRPNITVQENGIETFTWISKEFKGILRGGIIERKVVLKFKNGVITSIEGHNISERVL